ncbi:MAG TPA: hypothetical protein VK853_06700 [Ilumatobacteraceae bacterium]|nr:hypothetical protein [Ilumatobacteraceae bacterium]
MDDDLRPDPSERIDPGADVTGAPSPEVTAEERIAQRRLAMIEAGRRKGGVLGAAAAGAMLGLRDVYEGPPKDDDIVIEIEAAGEPGDIDVDGIRGTVAEVDYWAPPPRNPLG